MAPDTVNQSIATPAIASGIDHSEFSVRVYLDGETAERHGCETEVEDNLLGAVAICRKLPEMSADVAAKNVWLVKVLPINTPASDWMPWLVEQAGGTPVEAGLQGNRFAMCANRIVYMGEASRLPSALRVISSFCILDAVLQRLEGEVAKSWAQIDKDIRLTHEVTPSDLPERKHVNEMTVWSTRLRVTHNKLEHAVASTMTARTAEKKLVAQLLTECAFEDRMECTDDAIEIFTDLYELANDRLLEFSYFFREYKLELWIIVILLVETILLLAEMYLHSRG